MCTQTVTPGTEVCGNTADEDCDGQINDPDVCALPINNLPVITSTPVTTAAAGQPYNYTVEATDADAGDQLTFSLPLGPSGMTINAGSGLIQWTPGDGQNGQHDVTVQVEDEQGGLDFQTFIVTVAAVNGGPTARDDTYEVRMGETLSVNALGVIENDTDPNNDPLQAMLVQGPGNGTLNFNANGSFQYTPHQISTTPSGEFDVVVKYQALRGLNIISTPMVASLTNDNNDGKVDQNDIPDIVFATFPTDQFSGGAIKAISGDDGRELFTAGAPNQIATLNEIAVGDIDGDGFPEIVAAHSDGQHLIAFEHTGAFKWLSDDDVLPGRRDSGGAIAIANLDGSGAPEIIVGASVYSADGELLGDGRDLGGTTGFNSFSAISAVADVDLDGAPEIIAGPTAYRLVNGVLQRVWHRADRGDGFVGIGNFDDDPFAEIVIVANQFVYMLNHDGSNAEVWNPPTHAPVVLPMGGPVELPPSPMSMAMGSLRSVSPDEPVTWFSRETAVCAGKV